MAHPHTPAASRLPNTVLTTASAAWGACAGRARADHGHRDMLWSLEITHLICVPVSEHSLATDALADLRGDGNRNLLGDDHTIAAMH